MQDLKHHSTTDDNETPPPHSQSLTLLSFPNRKTPNVSPHTAETYKECLKNHAVAIGGHAVDGCGEFMPDPTLLKCSACGCHRNFHRRDTTAAAAGGKSLFLDFHRAHQISPSTSPSPPPQPTSYAYGSHLLLSLITAAEQTQTVATPGTPAAIKISSRKRIRTKFSQEQKVKMLKFAEIVGWKMQRCNDKLVTDFCNEIGIKRRIFKVWMHNNKTTLGKKETTPTTTTTTAADVSIATGDRETVQDSTNGSSSSS